MPNTGPSPEEWKSRLRRYAIGDYKFGSGRKPGAKSFWRKELNKIDTCPKHRNKALVNALGRKITCVCGYHTEHTIFKQLLGIKQHDGKSVSLTSTKSVQLSTTLQPSKLVSSTRPLLEKAPVAESYTNTQLSDTISPNDTQSNEAPAVTVPVAESYTIERLPDPIPPNDNQNYKTPVATVPVGVAESSFTITPSSSDINLANDNEKNSVPLLIPVCILL